MISNSETIIRHVVFVLFRKKSTFRMFNAIYLLLYWSGGQSSDSVIHYLQQSWFFDRIGILSPRTSEDCVFFFSDQVFFRLFQSILSCKDREDRVPTLSYTICNNHFSLTESEFCPPGYQKIVFFSCQIMYSAVLFLFNSFILGSGGQSSDSVNHYLQQSWFFDRIGILSPRTSVEYFFLIQC